MPPPFPSRKVGVHIMVSMEKKHPGKVKALIKQDLTLQKNSIEKSKSVYTKINSPT